MEQPRIYKIIVAPGIIFYTRAPDIEWVANSISKGESIHTGDRTGKGDVETVIGSYVAITRNR